MDSIENIEVLNARLQVSELVIDAMKDVAKIEADIKKLPRRGVLQLNYEPQGDDVPNRQQKEILRDIQKLKEVVENLKANVLIKVEEIIASLPVEQRDILRQMAEEKILSDKIKHKIAPIQEKNVPEDKSGSIESTQIDKPISKGSNIISVSKFVDLKDNNLNITEATKSDVITHTKFSSFLQYQPGISRAKEIGMDKEVK